MVHQHSVSSRRITWLVSQKKKKTILELCDDPWMTLAGEDMLRGSVGFALSLRT